MTNPINVSFYFSPMLKINSIINLREHPTLEVPDDPIVKFRDKNLNLFIFSKIGNQNKWVLVGMSNSSPTFS